MLLVGKTLQSRLRYGQIKKGDDVSPLLEQRVLSLDFAPAVVKRPICPHAIDAQKRFLLRGKGCESEAESLCAFKLNHRINVVPFEFVSAVQIDQFDQEGQPHHFAAEFFHQVNRRARRAAGRQQIVDD